MKSLRLKIGFVLLTAFLLGGFYFLWPRKTQVSASLTNASATLANSRLSFYGQVNVGASAGASTINIKTSGNIADKNTNHLFPNDVAIVGPNTDRTVTTIVDNDTFVLNPALTTSVSDGAPVYVVQSGALTISFTLSGTNIPAGGYLRVMIPDPPTNGNDGLPDTAGSLADNGFDLNQMGTGDIVTSGGTGCTWGTETLTVGSGSSHRYKVLTTTACTGGTITVTFDGTTKDLINPAPIHTGHTQGTADIYTIDVDTFDGDPDAGGNLIDTTDIKVAPIEAVLVSATVDETLSFTISGVNTGTTGCGQTLDVTTTAMSVPWGTLATANSFSEAAQQLAVSTNADGGYSVTIEENDQMGYDGTLCNMPTDDTADETDNPPCIKDTVCGATACSEAAARNWIDATTYHGLGISLQDIIGTDAMWDWDGKPAETTCTSGTFCARQIADQQAGNNKATIMTNGNQVPTRSIYVCYRIAISSTQPAGYYYNKVRYTAMARF